MAEQQPEPQGAAEAAQAPKKPNPLGYEKIGKLLFRFSIPAITGMLVNAIYNIVDQIFLGNGVNMLAMAATNIAFPITTICTAVALLLGIGGASNFNLNLGAKKAETASRMACNAIALLVIFGIAIGAAVLVFLQPILLAFGGTAAIMPYAVPYTGIIAVGAPFLILTTGGCHLIRADGSPTYAMLCLLSGAVFNIIFDPIFLFVFGMGIRGIALATTLGQVLSAGMVVYYLLRKFHAATLKRAYLRPRWIYVKRIFALGAEAFFNQLAHMAVQITLNNTLKHYGAQSAYGSDTPIAVVGALSKLHIMFMAFPVGVVQACQPIASFNYGAKQYGRVKLALKKALFIVCCVSVVAFLCFQLFPRQLAMIFGTGNELYFQFAVKYLRIYLLMTFANGLQPFASGFFTAIGKAKLGIFMSLTRQIIFLLPLLLILPTVFGIDGALYAAPIADSAAAALAIVLLVLQYKDMTRLELAQKAAT